MKRFFLSMLALLLSGIVFGQNVQIINKTKAKINKIVQYKERDTDRHTYEYNGSVWSFPKYESEAIEPVDIEFSEKEYIDINGTKSLSIANGIQSIICFADNDSVYVLWGQKISNGINKLVVDEKAERMHVRNFDELLICDVEGRTDLHFNIQNNTSYTIYSIYPWLSDENWERRRLFTNPDQRLIPGEKRDVLLVEDRTYDSYIENNPGLQLRIFGIDKDSKPVMFLVKSIALEADDIIISPDTIELMPLNSICPKPQK